MVRQLVAAGHIVIACGGGGPPVFNEKDPRLGLEGIDAVADKDRVAAILGRESGAQVLLILTNVEAAADFVRAGGGGERAIIAELAHGLAALQGEAGTTITKEHG